MHPVRDMRANTVPTLDSGQRVLIRLFPPTPKFQLKMRTAHPALE